MSTAVATAPVTTTRQEVEDLIHAYVQCIDDDRLEEWPDFFTDDCLYKVIPRENADLGLPVAVMFCDSKGMLRDRIVALRKANIYAPHFYRHLVSNTRILGEQGGVITAQTNYGVFQTLLDGETRVYNTGKYVDKIVRVNGQLRFKEKLCVFDTYRIQTLMVTPL
jgi:anthranilate 1,2-dioxygenase small subunit